MKQHIRPDIDYKKCNAYSGTSFLYAAIRVENRPVFATNINDEKAREVPDGMKGGIIVFHEMQMLHFVILKNLPKGLIRRVGPSANLSKDVMPTKTEKLIPKTVYP